MRRNAKALPIARSAGALWTSGSKVSPKSSFTSATNAP